MSAPAVPETGSPACELCAQAGGSVLWSRGAWRVVRVSDADFPAFYRVIAKPHVAEFSQLDTHERRRCMDVVAAVEGALIALLRPAKVNLAALGNMVPHLHWHVVARFGWDSHFPQPIWGVRQREVSGGALSRLAVPLPALDAAVLAAVEAVDRTGGSAVD